MRKGSVDAAESLTARIGQRVTTHNKTAFLKCPRGSREMWNLVRSVTGKAKHKYVLNKDLTADHLNQYFSAISTDPDYRIPLVKHTASQVLEEFAEWHIFRMLDTIHPTAMGLDGIPEWFIRIAAAAFAMPVTHLFNMSLNSSIVPSQWKASRITPIPKTAQPATCQDYRPISVTPILSRLMEKELVRSFFISHTSQSRLFTFIL